MFRNCYRAVTLLFLCCSSSMFAQHPVVDSVLTKIRLDSLVAYVNDITGENPVLVNGVSDTIKSRHKNRPGNELAYRYILQKFTSFGLLTDSMVFSVTGKNALAIQPGSLYPNSYVILCAHYDSMPNASVSPAADDDGSGVAAVLEAARVLSQFVFEHSIIYAIWDEEEQGKIGSAAYALQANNNNDSIVGVLNMDAIAWDGDDDGVAMIHTGSVSNSLALAMLIDAVNVNYAIGLDLNLTNPGATYSDHASFWDQGFGAVLIIEDWQYDANPHYHTATDLIDYFNLPYYEKMSRLSIASTAELAVPVGFLSTEEKNDESVRLFPNPSSGLVYVALEHFHENISIRLSDLQGKTVLVQDFVNTRRFALNCSEMNAGYYLLHIRSKLWQKTLRLVIN